MPTWLSVILEIIKLTIPALIVFFTVYHLLRQYLDGQQRLRLIEVQQAQRETTLPLRLQAYERLSLFCERIMPPSLLLRIRPEGLSASELRLALLVAVQQEFDHNITQQIYVSPSLWEIIKMAREDVVDSISLVAEKIDPQSSGVDLAQALLNFQDQRPVTGPEKALEAIRKEVGLLF